MNNHIPSVRSFFCDQTANFLSTARCYLGLTQWVLQDRLECTRINHGAGHEQAGIALLARRAPSVRR